MSAVLPQLQQLVLRIGNDGGALASSPHVCGFGSDRFSSGVNRLYSTA